LSVIQLLTPHDVSPDHLRRLSEGTQEGAVHSVAIGKTRLPGDDVDWMAVLFHHQPGGLDAQVLDGLGRRLAGLGAERTLNWRGLRCAASASCPTVSGAWRLHFAYASAVWIRSDFGSSSSSAENYDWRPARR
jgi:hypothetical protein